MVCFRPKKVLVALPPGMLDQIDAVAKLEHRTRSELIREALRLYVFSFQRRHPHIEIDKIIADLYKDFADEAEIDVVQRVNEKLQKKELAAV